MMNYIYKQNIFHWRLFENPQNQTYEEPIDNINNNKKNNKAFQKKFNHGFLYTNGTVKN